jgi:hypothetical protein
MNRILFFVFAVVVLASCQKEVDDLIGNGGGSGGGNNNTPTDYQPVSANSEWDYLSTNTGPSHLVALGTDTTINSLRYYKFNTTTNAGNRKRLHKQSQWCLSHLRKL